MYEMPIEKEPQISDIRGQTHWVKRENKPTTVGLCFTHSEKHWVWPSDNLRIAEREALLLVVAFASRLTALAPNLGHMHSVTRYGFAAFTSDGRHMLLVPRNLLATLAPCFGMTLRVSMPTATRIGSVLGLFVAARSIRTCRAVVLLITLYGHDICSLPAQVVRCYERSGTGKATNYHSLYTSPSRTSILCL